MLILILLIFAFACFMLAAFNPPWPRPNLVALGLACWVLSVILTRHPL